MKIRKENDPKRKRPKWTTNKIENDQNRKRPKQKMTKIEYDQNRKQPKQKTTKIENDQNTPRTAGGPGGRDRTLAVKSRKTSEKSPFFL